ncbi:hypothetical protein AVEN_60939-1 [Araneus ventricosus]|uniref:Uncharacterized protein n=1 Tax=Araneus ventricosus TaxID=182803 RepID=A0A4Y2NCW9_ARAVE|nr:hypothetical protein AVEN_63028-1 [Araneus ventricosus]GBN34171.1 hypothetical protein AVEN_174342-1 [Araneus ventricosus]GBN36756.1 hypothetical protein AVEN_24317-1 [Araneus ventricosus]GBN36762.1 hypothetical protein AVEN_60939-1 [Araneus ventricosus]
MTTPARSEIPNRSNVLTAVKTFFTAGSPVCTQPAQLLSWHQTRGGVLSLQTTTQPCTMAPRKGDKIKRAEDGGEKTSKGESKEKPAPLAGEFVKSAKRTTRTTGDPNPKGVVEIL